MTDSILIANLMQRLEQAERELVLLRESVHGQMPADSTLSIVERLSAVEKIDPSEFDASRDHVVPRSQRGEEDEYPPILEIEWGKPSSAPSGSSATITLQPCQEDGTSYADADTAKVYIRPDREDVNLDATDWDTSTILSFVRFPLDTTTDSCVGVLVGACVYGGTATTPHELLYDRSGAVGPYTSDPWDRDNPPANTDGVVVPVVTWVEEDGGFTGNFMIRLLTFDSAGMLKEVSSETQYP